ncbi:hypothetical protein [Arthrobacter sp. CAL618]|uniref:hypothetical protein n=1 Tax=Arthrobacter sp. CAL618 TaxID=1055770 RepID=UPI0004288AC1|nr:hypothetical protein [Arthrobacter sp. CAL618]
MRTFGAAFFTLVALVLAGIALPGAWIDRNFVQLDGFVELAGPLGSDPEFQAQLTSALASEATANAGLPEALTGIVEPLIAEAAGNVVGLPGYPAAWNDTLQRSHELSFPADADLFNGVDSPEPVRLDLAPVLALALQEVGTRLGVDVPAPEQTLVEVASPERQSTVGQLAAVAGLWPILGAGAVVSALSALGLARRRSTTLAFLGLGTAALGVLYWAGVRAAPEILERVRAERGASEGSISALFQDGLVARAAEVSEPLCLAVIGVGMVLLLVGVASRLISGGRRTTVA